MAAPGSLPRERADLPAPLVQLMLNTEAVPCLPTVLAKGCAAAAWLCKSCFFGG